MTDMNKRKGRPKGSEKDDSAALAAIADMILADPTLRPTTAMRRYKKKAPPSEIRRLQVKWKERGETLLAQAQARAEVCKAAQASVGSSRRLSIAQLAAMGGFLGTPAIRAARGLDLSPGLKAFVEYQNSPAIKLIREIEESPAMRLIRQIENNGVMRRVREHQQMIDKLTKFGYVSSPPDEQFTNGCGRQ